MTIAQMTDSVAIELGILSKDGNTVISGKITRTNIEDQLNIVYQEILIPYLSDKYPQDFTQKTYPRATYTATGVASADSTGTTLVATASIFDNTMEGFYVYNSTDGERAKIATYTNGTTVTLDATIGDTWDGDTIYVLGNEYTFGGDTFDLKEIKAVSIKYSSTDNYFRVTELRDKDDLIFNGNESFAKSDPKIYLCSVQENETPVRAIGLLPFPDDYRGSFIIEYITQVPRLDDNDSPVLVNTGICDVMMNGVKAWGKRVLGQYTEAGVYEEIDPRTRRILPKGTLGLAATYKPKQRNGPTKVRLGGYYEGLRRRNY